MPSIRIQRRPRIGKGGPATQLTVSKIERELKSMSPEEKSRRKEWIIREYYNGDRKAFERDLEKRPFYIARLMVSLRPKVEPEKPRIEEKPKEKPKAEKAEVKPQPSEPKIEEKPKVEEKPKTPEYAPGTWVKLTYHEYPQIVVEKTEEGNYRLYDPWSIKWREESPRYIERKVEPNPNALKGSPEEMASRVKASEELRYLSKAYSEEKPKTEEKTEAEELNRKRAEELNKRLEEGRRIKIKREVDGYVVYNLTDKNDLIRMYPDFPSLLYGLEIYGFKEKDLNDDTAHKIYVLDYGESIILEKPSPELKEEKKEQPKVEGKPKEEKGEEPPAPTDVIENFFNSADDKRKQWEIFSYKEKKRYYFSSENDLKQFIAKKLGVSENDVHIEYDGIEFDGDRIVREGELRVGDKRQNIWVSIELSKEEAEKLKNDVETARKALVERKRRKEMMVGQGEDTGKWYCQDKEVEEALNRYLSGIIFENWIPDYYVPVERKWNVDEIVSKGLARIDEVNGRKVLVITPEFTRMLLNELEKDKMEEERRKKAEQEKIEEMRRKALEEAKKTGKKVIVRKIGGYDGDAAYPGRELGWINIYEVAYPDGRIVKEEQPTY